MSTTAVRERPILFSAPMVRAILDGRKTQTRRVVLHRHAFVQHFEKCTNDEVASARRDLLHLDDCAPHKAECLKYLVEHCLYGVPGDRLWVRETWAGWEGRAIEQGPFWYRATDGKDRGKQLPLSYVEREPRWRSPLFMPRWASRIDLEVVSVRVERLQEIGEEDAIAEGVVKVRDGCYVVRGTEQDRAGIGHSSASMGFAVGWDTINAERAPWSSNPWVWAIEFRRTKP